MIILPFKVKNHLERFPHVTASLVALNVLVFVLTSDSLLVIRTEVAKSMAFGFGISPWINFFTAAFLHVSLFHLFTNMVFLWTFGPSVEERLGTFRFLLLYFAAGLAGDIFQASLDLAFIGTVRPGIGASGCIMGLAGACWYLFPWCTVCVWYWIGLFWMGVKEIAAFWVIGAYFLLDLFSGGIGALSGRGGAVAHFAHLGGLFAGVAICVLFRMRRDSAAVSELRDAQTDMRNPDRLSLPILQARLEEAPGDAAVLRQIAELSLERNQTHHLDIAMETAGPALLSAEPELVINYLLKRNGRLDIYPPGKLLGLANRLSAAGRYGVAATLYRRLADHFQGSPTGENALFQHALSQWHHYHNAAACLRSLEELERIYPLSLFGPKIQALRGQLRVGIAS
jgi:membrane associated rhomboid family serine protease